MTTPFSTLDGFDTALLDAYRQFLSQLPDSAPAVAQRRFAQYVVFPSLGWGLIEAGQGQARATDEPAVLHGMLQRFVKCAYACWGEADADGLHWGGVDHCALVVPALHAAPLGFGWLDVAFHGARPLSRQGSPVLRHAANLLTVLNATDWKHREVAVTGALKFSAGAGASHADRAFILFLLALQQRQVTAAAEALERFARGWLKSDWGRYKPATQPAWTWSLLVLAERHLPDAWDATFPGALMAPEALASWRRHAAWRLQGGSAAHLFGGELGWLDALPFDPEG